MQVIICASYNHIDIKLKTSIPNLWPRLDGKDYPPYVNNRYSLGWLWLTADRMDVMDIWDRTIWNWKVFHERR